MSIIFWLWCWFVCILFNNNLNNKFIQVSPPNPVHALLNKLTRGVNGHPGQRVRQRVELAVHRDRECAQVATVVEGSQRNSEVAKPVRVHSGFHGVVGHRVVRPVDRAVIQGQESVLVLVEVRELQRDNMADQQEGAVWDKQQKPAHVKLQFVHSGL